DGVLSGYNCSVFAYGATGAGKTYTMLGSEESPGIMYLTMAELYRRIEARRDEKSCEVLVSYQEVYNEQIHDLLEPKGPLAIREDPEKGVVVQGLSFHQPKSAEQLLEMLANGNKNRTQHPTDANATSSRSHAVFQIHVKQQDRVVGLRQDVQVAKMSLIDLAGSERASVANTRGERLREGANINRSLLALINVINALADAKSRKTHIPYRDSKLTRLLKDSIGGNCRTIMIAAVSPSSLAYEDTYNTLKYANRAKEIKLALKSNVLSLDCHISKYASICEQLQAEVADLRAKLRAYEDAARDAEQQAAAPPASPSSSPAGPCRSEGAVPETLSASSAHKGSDGEQQALGAGQPSPLGGEEEAPEAVPPSSPRTAQQADPQPGGKEPCCALQGASCSQAEPVVAAILSVARKQYSLLKAANLLTPDMASEFEELQRLVRGEAATSLQRATALSEPTESSGAAPAPRTQEHRRARAAAAPPAVPVLPSPLPSPALAAPGRARKRRRSEMGNTSRPGSPHSLPMRAKRRRGSCPPGGEVEAPGALQSPEGAPSPLLPGSPPRVCPLTVTKRRVPLGTSAAQNCCSPAVRGLNNTFELGEDGVAQCPPWEKAQCLLEEQHGPLPRASIPVFAMRGSSIPKPSWFCGASTQKQRRAASTASRSLGALRSRSARVPSCSQGCAQPPSIAERPSGGLGRRGRS
ncbi:KI18B protein, partial [Penelope pileata]|nr:KI18B protein [Penelope pileata]